MEWILFAVISIPIVLYITSKLCDTVYFWYMDRKYPVQYVLSDYISLDEVEV